MHHHGETRLEGSIPRAGAYERHPSMRMTAFLAVAPLLVATSLCGCSETTVAKDGPGPGGLAGTQEPGTQEPGAQDPGKPPVSSCAGVGLAAKDASWALPYPAHSTAWATGESRYALVDIHGDGKPDLVVTSTPADPTVGEAQWLVYPNDGNAFAKTAESWKLPYPAHSTAWATGESRYALVDIHGDGKPDLVVTSTPADPTVGETQWLVYANDGKAFAKTAESWKLPSPAHSTAWATGESRYALVDIHGDGKPDLVVTSTPADPTVGEAQWLVYPNDGNAFAKTAESWKLPYPAHSTAWATGESRYALVDIHGDGKPDLVVTSTPADPTVGETQWLVYPNDGKAFTKTAASWKLPSPAHSTAWMTGESRYALVDIHGDGKPDLVVTSAPADSAVGETQWLVYPNDGNAFTKTAESWKLPYPAHSTAWATGESRYALVDIHGDHRPDLVVTSDGTNPALGETSWSVYDNVCE
jgi:hypothetical protein